MHISGHPPIQREVDYPPYLLPRQLVDTMEIVQHLAPMAMVAVPVIDIGMVPPPLHNHPRLDRRLIRLAVRSHIVLVAYSLAGYGLLTIIGFACNKASVATRSTSFFSVLYKFLGFLGFLGTRYLWTRYLLVLV
jgi:hypothetical protein